MFTVELPNTSNVSILKDLIKEKNTNSFGDIDAKNISLFDARDFNLDESVTLDDSLKLSPPRKKLASIFTDIPDENSLHIIVKVPGTSQQS